MAPIALLSVSNKNGLVPLAKALHQLYGYTLISSGGTAKTLEKEGIPITKVSDYTGSPEILGGRVKTLHPKIHGGILAKRKENSHISDLEKNAINAIDLVVVNLYPFKEVISDPNVNSDIAIENIDIGGPAMIRASAKNYHDVIILTSPKQYESFLKSLENGKGKISQEKRLELALEAYEHTASYDITISHWMKKKVLSSNSPLLSRIPLKQKLRYGENPHQSAQWYSQKEGWGKASQLQGKELSTNNLLDLEAAILTVREFGYNYAKNTSDNSYNPAAVIIKHTNPCGVAIGDTIDKALKKALDADRVSAFGGIVALNKPVNKDSAIELKSLFLECVVAPKFEQEAIEILQFKTNLRLLELRSEDIEKAEKCQIRSILGGVLIQELDIKPNELSTWQIVTDAKPSKQEEKDLLFAWNIVRHVRSNAIVVAAGGQSLGIGAGQMNRIGAAKIALEQADLKAKNAVLASDGFFPFDDCIKLAAKYAIKAIIQPGGSIRDSDSIKACNDLNISMITTGKRHFLH